MKRDVDRSFNNTEDYYVYIYFDVRNKGKYHFSNNELELCFLYEPIYVGKGKKYRVGTHKWKMLNTEEYINDFIERGREIYNEVDKNRDIFIILRSELTEYEALKLERKVEKCIGRKNTGKGSLLNLSKCGYKNFVPNDGFHGIKNITHSQREELLNNSHRGENHGLHRTMTEEEREKWLDDNRRGDNHFTRKNKTEKELNDGIDEKMRGKNHWLYRTMTEEEREKWLDDNRRGDNNWLNKMTEEEREEWLNNNKRGGNNGWNKVDWNIKESILDNYFRGDNNGFKKVAHLYRGENHGLYKNKTEKEREEWLNNNIRGKNNPTRKNKTPEEYEEGLNNNRRGENHGTVKSGGFTEEHCKNISKSKKGVYAGKNNPMFGKGHKLKGSKNGRAKKRLIFTPKGEVFYCNGTYKKFCEEYCSRMKPNPCRKYFSRIIKEDREIDGWYIKDIYNEKEIENYNYINYL